MNLNNCECIRIYNGKTFRDRAIFIKSNFFKAGEYYIVRIDDSKITFLRPNIDNNFKLHKASKANSGLVKMGVVADLPLGEFKFNEEKSNEDKIVIYYK